ncbi:hypothetical protein PS15p_203421 [Mucor circinelloides]
MSSNSSASEEQLPEIFRRLGKTVPPRTKRSYSGSQPPQDTGFRIVRQTEQPYYQQHSPNNFHHANYNDMVGYSSTPPPLYYRPQMSSENNGMGYHTTYSPNDNNSNSTVNNNRSIPVSYHSPSSSVSSTPPPAPVPTSLPQHGLSFIPKDAHPNPNPIISFVRNPNAGAMPATAYSTPYQFFGNSNMNQANVNNGQQVLHPPPPIATSVSVTNAATAPATSSLDSPPASKATSSGTSVILPKSSNSKKDSATSSDKALSSSSPTSRKSEQKKPQQHVSNDNHDASDDSQDEAPVHQRDILAKSIKIIASRPLGSTDKKSSSASRKHTRQSDSEAHSESDEEIVVNRKIVVVSNDIDIVRRSNERESSPIRKKPRRLISPTIPKRRRSLSDTSDNGNVRITKSRYAVRSPSPMSHDRRTWSRSRSRSHSRSRSLSRSLSRSRSHSRSRLRTRSRSRSRSPSGQTRRHRRSVSSTGRKRDYSPGTSSDEERAPFLRGDIDRYIPDYNRRPLPPQWRDRPPSTRKLASSSTTETNGNKKSSMSLSFPPPATKKPASTDSKTSINDRLNRNSLSSKPKDLRSYPPLGTSFVSLNSPRSRAEMETSAPSKQASVKKSTPIVSHRIITKPSPVAARAETTSHNSLASDTKKSVSPAAKTAQLSSQLNSIKPDHVENDDSILPIKQEIVTESTREKPKPVARSNEARHASAMTGIETSSKSTALAMSMNGSSSAISVNQGHASFDTSSQKTNVVNAPKVNYDPEASSPNQARTLSVFSDTPIVNGIETHAASSLKPLVKGKSTDTSTAATATMPTTALNGPSQPTKRVTITPEARAAIRKRAAKEQERLDQERLRQLDIDDRDDIVMDIACPSQSRSPAVIIVNNDTTATASEMLTNNNTTLIQTSIAATAADPNNHHTMTSAAQHINDNTTGSFITTSDEQVTLIVNHPTSARDMTSHENVPSSDTTTVGTNSAFTNLVSSNDKMSVPDGCTTEQTKSMPTQNIPPASTSKAPVAVAATKPATKKSSNKRLPTPWKVKMNDSGDIYYHNPVTGEETFVRPE